jgi:hypothetical protein
MTLLTLLLPAVLVLTLLLVRRLPTGLRVAVLFAAGCVTLGIMPLMGLPGAVIVELSRPIISLVLGSDAYARLPADAEWPIAILVTLVWPISIIFGYLLAYRFLRVPSRIGRYVVLAVVLCTWGAALSTFAVSAAESPL